MPIGKGIAEALDHLQKLAWASEGGYGRVSWGLYTTRRDATQPGGLQFRLQFTPVRRSSREYMHAV